MVEGFLCFLNITIYPNYFAEISLSWFVNEFHQPPAETQFFTAGFKCEHFCARLHVWLCAGHHSYPRAPERCQGEVLHTLFGWPPDNRVVNGDTSDFKAGALFAGSVFCLGPQYFCFLLVYLFVFFV